MDVLDRGYVPNKCLPRRGAKSDRLSSTCSWMKLKKLVMKLRVERKVGMDDDGVVGDDDDDVVANNDD